jgi:hypothetical protein
MRAVTVYSAERRAKWKTVPPPFGFNQMRARDGRALLRP